MIWTAAELSDALVNCVDAGPMGIAALGIAEKLCPVMPSYVVFVVIGMIVAAGQSDLTYAMLAIAAGSTAGSLIWYGAGLTLGEKRSHVFVARFGRYMRLTAPRYQHVIDSFHRNLLVIAAVGQTVPAVRVYLAIPAGALGVALRPFLLGTFIGSLAWSAPLIGLGYLVGDSSSDPASAGLILVALLIGLELLAVLIWRMVRPSHHPESNPAGLNPPSPAPASALPHWRCAQHLPSPPAPRSSFADRNRAAPRRPT
jgi:alkaline phosphatase